jgi:group I intron endonuclease
MTGVIYCVTSPSGKKYYGFTFNFNKRRTRHIRDAQNNKFDSHFHRSIRKYGSENLIWTIVETINSELKNELMEELYEREKYWIKKDKTYLRKYGYNMTLGGTGGDTFTFKPKHLQDITRAKQRIVQLNPSKETREKRSKSLKGKKRSELTRQRISKGKTGHKNSETHKENSSKALRKAKEGKLPYNIKSVDMFDINGNFIKTFPSIAIASRETKHSSTTIVNICKMKKENVCDHIFKYHL